MLTSNKKVKQELYKRKMILSFLCFLLLSLICITKSFAVVKPTKQFYVNDYANVLSEETKNYIINTNVELQEKTGAQIVVVTVPDLEGMSVEEYANQLFRKFGIGDKEKNNGLLLLCSYGDRKLRVEVGYGLEGVLPDGKTGRIQDQYMIPYLKEDNFDEGLKNGYNAFLKVIADEYQVKITGQIESQEAESKEGKFQRILPILFLIFMIFLAITGRGGFFFIGGGRGGFGGFGGGPGGFSGGGGSSGGGRKFKRILKRSKNGKTKKSK